MPCVCHVAGHVTFVPCGYGAVDVPRVDLMKSETMYVLTPVPYGVTLQCHPNLFVGFVGFAKETR